MANFIILVSGLDFISFITYSFDFLKICFTLTRKMSTVPVFNNLIHINDFKKN